MGWKFFVRILRSVTAGAIPIIYNMLTFMIGNFFQQ